jgi:thiol-disulfide isomerase/thioredoxin
MTFASLLDHFAAALPSHRYLQTDTDEQPRRRMQVYDIAQLSATQQEILVHFHCEMKIPVYSGIWCEDCVEQCPLIQRIAEANKTKINLRFIERPISGFSMSSSLSVSMNLTTMTWLRIFALGLDTRRFYC